jgi:antitoxin FitA
VPSVQIKDVPDDVHVVLRQRAASAGQSLQEYLLGRLVAEARRPTLDELLSRAGGRAGGSTRFTDAAHVVRADRDAA